MLSKARTTLISVILFCTIFCTGFYFALNKPFWLDEYYSLTQSIHSASYQKILLGHLTGEGNNSPVFYASQKLLCDLISYDSHRLIPQNGRIVHYPLPKNAVNMDAIIFSGIVFYYDPFSTAYLRIISLLLLALVPAILFWYFTRRFNVWWGCYAVLLTLSSPLYWWHGLEARPYIHLFTITTMQILLFIELTRPKNQRKKLWPLFASVNILAAFTFTISALQVLVMALFFTCTNSSIFKWKRVVTAFILPVLISAYYYSLSVKLKFTFLHDPAYYFLANMPIEIAMLIAGFLGLACLSWYYSQKRIMTTEWLSLEEIRHSAGILWLAVIVPLCYVIILSYFFAIQPPAGNKVYFYERYLMGLGPLGVILMVFFSERLTQIFTNRILKTTWYVILFGLLVMRFLLCYNRVHFWVGGF